MSIPATEPPHTAEDMAKAQERIIAVCPAARFDRVVASGGEECLALILPERPAFPVAVGLFATGEMSGFSQPARNGF